MWNNGFGILLTVWDLKIGNGESKLFFDLPSNEISSMKNK